MKKSLLALWSLSVILYLFCIFPVIRQTPDRVYATFSSTLLPKDLTGDACWRVGSGYVLRVEDPDTKRVLMIPRSQRVLSYDRENAHIVITGDPFLQGIPSPTGSRLGAPYLID